MIKFDFLTRISGVFDVIFGLESSYFNALFDYKSKVTFFLSELPLFVKF